MSARWGEISAGEVSPSSVTTLFGPGMSGEAEPQCVLESETRRLVVAPNTQARRDI